MRCRGCRLINTCPGRCGRGKQAPPTATQISNPNP